MTPQSQQLKSPKKVEKKKKTKSSLHLKNNVEKFSKKLLLKSKTQENNPDTGVNMEEEDNMEEETESMDNKQDAANQNSIHKFLTGSCWISENCFSKWLKSYHMFPNPHLADNVYDDLDDERCVRWLVKKFYRGNFSNRHPKHNHGFWQHHQNNRNNNQDKTKLERLNSFIINICDSGLQVLLLEENGVFPHLGNGQFIKTVHEIKKEIMHKPDSLDPPPHQELFHPLS